MKANTPEKIYLRHNHKGDIGAGWLIFPLTNEDIEYTCTDAFIEKAAEWLDKTLRDTDFYENEIELFIKEFKKAMKL